MADPYVRYFYDAACYDYADLSPDLHLFPDLDMAWQEISFQENEAGWLQLAIATYENSTSYLVAYMGMEIEKDQIIEELAKKKGSDSLKEGSDEAFIEWHFELLDPDTDEISSFVCNAKVENLQDKLPDFYGRTDNDDDDGAYDYDLVWTTSDAYTLQDRSDETAGKTIENLSYSAAFNDPNNDKVWQHNVWWGDASTIGINEEGKMYLGCSARRPFKSE